MAVRFSGDNQALIRSGIGLTSDTLPLTMCGWFKRVADRNTWSALLNANPGNTNDGELVTLNATGDTVIASSFAGQGTVNGPTVANGDWYFVAVTITSSNRNLYWRAEAAGSLSSDGPTTPTVGHHDNLTQLWIGDSPYSGEWLDGAACCVRLWSAELSSAELLAESNAFTPQRAADLEGAWRLSTIADVTDSSGNGRTLAGGSGAATDADEPDLAGDATGAAAAAEADDTLAGSGTLTADVSGSAAVAEVDDTLAGSGTGGIEYGIQAGVTVGHTAGATTLTGQQSPSNGQSYTNVIFDSPSGWNVYSTADDITFTNCTFRGNPSVEHVRPMGRRWVFDRCLFEGSPTNHAVKVDGRDAKTGSARFVNCNFDGTPSEDHIQFEGQDGDETENIVEHCEFPGNSTEDAIDVKSGAAIVVRYNHFTTGPSGEALLFQNGTSASYAHDNLFDGMFHSYGANLNDVTGECLRNVYNGSTLRLRTSTNLLIEDNTFDGSATIIVGLSGSDDPTDPYFKDNVLAAGTTVTDQTENTAYATGNDFNATKFSFAVQSAAPWYGNTGAATATEAGDVSAGSGVVGLGGSAAVGEAADVVAASGFNDLSFSSAVGLVVEADDVSAAAGVLVYTATGAPAEADDYAEGGEDVAINVHWLQPLDTPAGRVVIPHVVDAAELWQVGSDSTWIQGRRSPLATSDDQVTAEWQLRCRYGVAERPQADILVGLVRSTLRGSDGRFDLHLVAPVGGTDVDVAVTVVDVSQQFQAGSSEVALTCRRVDT